MSARHFAALVAGGAVVLALAGCASADDQRATDVKAGSQGVSAQRAVEKDIDSWALPLDAYRYSHSEVRNYAEHLQLEPCLRERGFERPVPWQDVTETTADGMNSVGTTLFTPELAARWGYGSPRIQSTSQTLWDQFAREGLELAKDPAFNTAFDSCLETVRAGNPLPSGEDILWTSELATAARATASKAPEVLAASPRWASCMAGAGFPGLPADPLEAPAIATSQRSAGSPAASKNELQMASADAKCMRTSGFTDSFYAANWRAEQVLLEKNASRLETIGASLASNLERSREVISELAPAAP